MIHRVKYPLIVLLCLALMISALGCILPRGETWLNLRLEKAPRLNETVKLTCIRSISFKSLFIGMTSDNITHEKIELDFRRIDPKTGLWVYVQPEEILVEGSFNWEAAIKIDQPNHRIEVSPQDVSADGDLDWEAVAKWGVLLEFSAIVKFPHEGNWRLCATSTRPGWDSDGVVFHVGEDSGMCGWQEDYRPSTGPSFPITPDERWPITVELDISKAPGLDETVELTWVINTIRDLSEVKSEIEFYHMEGTDRIEVPAEDVLVDGDLRWEGSLTKNSPVQLSATIGLHQEGDWEIHASADCYAEVEPINSGYIIFLNVVKEKGRWGWAQPH
jgi:hypothetical protein